MSADLHVHVLDNGCTRENVIAQSRNTLGSKYFDMNLSHRAYANLSEHLDKTGGTSDIHIGEVSWLKAAVTGDSETFVPDICAKLSNLIGEDFPTIDDDLILRVKGLYFDVTNETQYTVSDAADVIAWFEEHKGKEAFCISW